MDRQRTLLFIVIALAFMFVWETLVIPRLVPRGQEKPGGEVAKKKDDGAVSALDATNLDEKSSKEPSPPPAIVSLEAHPHQEITLGSDDPNSPYFLHVTLDSRGAAVKKVELNDPRYKQIRNNKLPLAVVGDDEFATKSTFSTRLLDAENLFGKRPLDEVDWEIVPESISRSGAQFRLKSGDGQIELRKTYQLVPTDEKQSSDSHYRDIHSSGYHLKLKLELLNHSAKDQELTYELQGPVGVPLEDRFNAVKFEDIRLGFLRADGVGADPGVLHAKDLVEQKKKNKTDIWKRPLKYIGVDVQYFAALVSPIDEDVKSPRIAKAVPEIIREYPKRPEFTALSVNLTSAPVKLLAAKEAATVVSHEFTLFTGPKRQELLDPLSAAEVVDFGWFASVSLAMLWLLNTLHGFGINYGIAIVCLTVIVRVCLLPLTIKQTASMQRMKEMQPKLKELQAKYGADREGFARAQMQLMREYNANPLAGCLPVFLQLPIFIGLYRALNGSVDLRLAPFLWIKNLAGPDALFPLGFVVPYFEWTEFNLLPCLTIVLFLVQQKMTMPPPTDPEQEMQYKMMNIMMTVMGVMFYRVAAGLCIYFLASSLWGIAERWLLDKFKLNQPAKKPEPTVALAGVPAGAAVPESNGTTAPATGGLGGLWNRMVEAADKESQLASQRRLENGDKKNSGNKKRKKR